MSKQIVEDEYNETLFFPASSMKRIMKISDEINNIGLESAACIGKLTQDFITQLILQSADNCTTQGRKTLKVEDIISVILSDRGRLQFLEDSFGPQEDN